MFKIVTVLTNFTSDTTIAEDGLCLHSDIAKAVFLFSTIKIKIKDQQDHLNMNVALVIKPSS